MSERFQLGGLPILFTYRDGGFGYDCSHCALCCKTAAIYLGPRQEALLPRLGGMQSIARLQKGGITHLRFGAGGCPALTGAGTCSFHDTSGLLSKPALCALFPFSILQRTRSFLIVSPNLLFVCPLHAPPLPGDRVVSHQETATLLNSFFGEEYGVFCPVAGELHPSLSLEREEAFSRLAGEAEQSAQICETLAQAAGVSAHDLRDRARRAFRLIEDELLEPGGELALAIARLLPTFRVPFLGLAEPDIDLALLLLCSFTARRHAISLCPLSISTIASLFDGEKKLAKLLAMAYAPIGLAAKPRLEDLGDGNAEIQLELSLLASRILKHPHERSLADWLFDLSRLRGAERIVLLRALSQIDFSYT